MKPSDDRKRVYSTDPCSSIYQRGSCQVLDRTTSDCRRLGRKWKPYLENNNNNNNCFNEYNNVSCCVKSCRQGLYDWRLKYQLQISYVVGTYVVTYLNVQNVSKVLREPTFQNLIKYLAHSTKMHRTLFDQQQRRNPFFALIIAVQWKFAPVQCDQRPDGLLNILSLTYNNGYLPKSIISLQKVNSKFCQMQKIYFLPKWQNFAKPGHAVLEGLPLKWKVIRHLHFKCLVPLLLIIGSEWYSQFWRIITIANFTQVPLLSPIISSKS